MLSVEALKAYGANTEQGLGRCMNNEAFYLRLVGMALEDSRFGQLRGVIESGSLDQGFELTHALKGVVGNLSLDPLYRPLCEMTELLRSRTKTDYSRLLTEIEQQYAALLALTGQ